ncbi:MAG: hypothetical protein ACRYGI_05380 [Janthinobacterium lividum]
MWWIKLLFFGIVISVITPYTIFLAFTELTKQAKLSIVSLGATGLIVYLLIGRNRLGRATLVINNFGDTHLTLVIALVLFTAAAIPILNRVWLKHKVGSLIWGRSVDPALHLKNSTDYLLSRGWSVVHRRSLVTSRIYSFKKTNLSFSAIFFDGSIPFSRFVELLWKSGATPAGNYVLIAAHDIDNGYLDGGISKNIKVINYKSLENIETIISLSMEDFQEKYRSITQNSHEIFAR